MTYRDATASVADEADLLRAERGAEIARLPPALVHLYGVRVARIAFGATGTTGALALGGTMLLGQRGFGGGLLVSWALAVAAYLVARVVAPIALRRQLARATRLTDDPFRDAAALRALDVHALAHRRVAAIRHASYAWPLVAATLLGPHTLHMAVAALLMAPLRMGEFDEWMQFTSALTPHVFAAGVYAAWRFPVTRTFGRHVLVATALSLLPGALLLGIPCLVVAVTAGALGLVAYRPMAAIIDREAVMEPDIQPAPRE